MAKGKGAKAVGKGAKAMPHMMTAKQMDKMMNQRTHKKMR